MGRPEKDGRCKKHPSHKNSNGVCPNCLRDRLANLSGGSSSSSRNNAGFSTSTASSTAYSSYDSDASSSAESPPRRRREERSGKRLFQVLRGRKKALKSSLSFSLPKEVERVSEKGKKEERKGKNGAGKLWAKFAVMGGGERKIQVEEGKSTLSHSKTVKEKSSSKWSFFA